MTDSVHREAAAILESRYTKGQQEYGMGLEKANLTTLRLIDEAIEEAADQLHYLVALKQRMLSDLTKPARTTTLMRPQKQKPQGWFTRLRRKPPPVPRVK